MSNKSKKGFSGTPQARERRTKVVERLEAQLLKGFKPALKPATGVDEPLTEGDVVRIKKELLILKTRI